MSKQNYIDKKKRISGYTYTRKDGTKVHVRPHNRTYRMKKNQYKEFQKNVSKDEEYWIKLDLLKELYKQSNTASYIDWKGYHDLKKTLKKYNLSEFDYERLMDELWKDRYVNKYSLPDKAGFFKYSITKKGNQCAVQNSNLWLEKMTKEELIAMAMLNIDDLKYYDLDVKANKYDIIDILEEKGIKQEHIDKFREEQECMKGLSNNQKAVLSYIYNASPDNSVDVIEKLFDKRTLDSLVKRGILKRKWISYHNKSFYMIDKSNEFMDIYKDSLSNHDPLPGGKMKKELPIDVMNSAKELSKNEREYSIMIDFERILKQPQRLSAVQGAETFTYRFDDFEMFGHTHPNRKEAKPSFADIKNMKYGKPEFIIAGETQDTIILNIENPEKHRYFVEHGNEDNYHKYLSLLQFHFGEKDKEEFYEKTGVKIYNYKPGMKIRMVDDPLLEKPHLSFSEYQLKKIKKGSYK